VIKILEINKIYNMDCLEGMKQIPVEFMVIEKEEKEEKDEQDVETK